MPKKPVKQETTPKTVKNPAKSEAHELELIKKAAEKNHMKVLNWDPNQLTQFARGAITLAQLEGISPKQLNDMAEVAFGLLAQGKLEDARKIFTGLTILNPYDAYYNLALGSIAQREGSLEEAHRRYSRAIEINSNIVSAYVNRGEVLILLGRLGDAIADFIKTVTLASNQSVTDPAIVRAKIILNVLRQQIMAAKQHAVKR